MPRIPVPCLLLLTDRRLVSPQWTLAQAVAPAVTGGCSLVVLREADLPAAPRLTVARFVRDGVRGRAALVLAGDAALALQASADGVHLDAPGCAADSKDVGAARAAIGPDRLLGVSVRSAGEAAQVSTGADYLLVEYDWSDPASVDARMASVEAVCRAATAAGTPVIVGTDPPLDLVSRLRTVGAAGVAVCRAGMAAPDRAAACRAYVERLGEDVDGR